MRETSLRCVLLLPRLFRSQHAATGHRPPLQSLLEHKIPLERIDLALTPKAAPNQREFDPALFTLPDGAGVEGRAENADVLLIDDTWVTGARVQSAAHCLKRRGARAVAVVVLARQIEPTYPDARSLMERITAAEFDPGTCAVHE